MLRFYEKMPDMKCLAGDTLPAFIIETEAGAFDSCRIIAASAREPDKVLVEKQCVLTSGGFRVQLTSEDTEKLDPNNTHLIHFRLTDPDGLHYRKLAGYLYVGAAAKGGESDE